VSDFARPASKRLDQALDIPLTIGERAKIVIQLGSAMLAGALLTVGWIELKYGPPDLNNIAELIIALASCVVAAPIFWIAVRGLLTNDPNTLTEQLVALATLAAMMMGDFVTATIIPIIMNLGHFLEERSVLGAQAAIEGLRKLHARHAMLVTPEGEKEVDPQSVKTGDVLVVRPGDVVPADGDIIEGSSTIDQSSITGESTPEDVTKHDAVFAGSVNLTGLIKIRVTKTGEKTTLGRVVGLLREAEQSKTPALKLIEQYASYYVPIILSIAGVVLFVTRDMSRAVTVLVVGCPGALILAGPTAMVAALALASRLGILIKNTRFLESLGSVDTVILDKTGTVTLGQLELVDSQPMNGYDQTALFERALPCAAASRHPVSRAVVNAARHAKVSAPDLDSNIQVEEISGKGTRATGNGLVTMLGRREWLLEEGIEVPQNPQHLGPIVWVGQIDKANGGQQTHTIGCLLLADVARPEAKQAIHDLRELGLNRTVLLTGDRREVAEQIGKSLEFDEVVAEVLPQQKLDTVRKESEQGNSVMMVGDGVNDALALASGDVGIALGAAASDIALQSADVALMTNDLGRLPLTVRLARRTRLTIHQNILIGATISIVFVWLGSMGIFGPRIGGFLHFFGELLVILNSARILGFANTEK